MIRRATALIDADELPELAQRVRELAPCRVDPEAFHASKDAIAKRLQKLATRAEGRSA